MSDPSKSDEETVLFAEAVRRHQAGEFALAADIYRRVARLAPDHVGARNNLGTALVRMGQLQEAEAAYVAVLSINPHHASALNNLAALLIDSGRASEGLDRARAAAALKPDYVEALNNQGIALRALGRHGEAIDCFTAAIDANPEFIPAHCGRAEAWAEMGDIQDAIAELQPAAAQRPAAFALSHTLANLLDAAGRTEEALATIERAIELDPVQPDAHFNRGNMLNRLGRPMEALSAFNAALAIQPRHAGALINRGRILRDLGRAEEALAAYEQAIVLRPKDPQLRNSAGAVLGDLGRDAEALEAYAAALALDPHHLGALNNLGITHIRLGDTAQALVWFERAINADPADYRGYQNSGSAHVLQENSGAAVAAFQQAIACNSAYAPAHAGLGGALVSLRRFEEAIAALDDAIALDDQDAAALDQMGNAYRGVRRLPEALTFFQRALELKPDSAVTLNNLGATLRDLGRADEAITRLDQAIAFNPDYAQAYYNRAVAEGDLKRYAEAAADYAKAMDLGVATAQVVGNLHQMRLHVCDWSDHSKSLSKIREAIEAGDVPLSPFTCLVSCDDPALQLRIASAYAQAECGGIAPAALPPPPGHGRIKVGYFSADFHSHATMHLIAELLEHHDRSRFEIIGFDFGPDQDDAWSRRASAALDRRIDVRYYDDAAVAALSRELGIGIAVDLKGYTANCRPGIFAHRAAPIQVSYLGYPGTLGLATIDYLIADHTVVPPDARPFYTEHVVYMPHTYQANCEHRLITAGRSDRKRLGLPALGFVYCCFNSSHKITPEVFRAWIKILQATTDSVLWLWVPDPAAQANLVAAAAAEGIASERLVFAPSLPAEQHLARIAAADLFLDTQPYGAHTTASDALRMNIPVLTVAGRSFASRVAASLLTPMGLSDLITSNLNEYVERAIAYAQDSPRLNAARVAIAQRKGMIFSSEPFTRDLEAAYVEMVRRACACEPPADLEVAELNTPPPTAMRQAG